MLHDPNVLRPAARQLRVRGCVVSLERLAYHPRARAGRDRNPPHWRTWWVMLGAWCLRLDWNAPDTLYCPWCGTKRYYLLRTHRWECETHGPTA